MLWWILPGVALLLSGLYLLRGVLVRRSRQQAAMMARMRSSTMYARLYPLLVKCRSCCVERILIRPEEVRVVLFRPSGRTYRFVFDQHGLDPVERPVALQALAQAIARDVPQLADHAKYYFSTHSSPRDGGGNFHWYEYAVQLDYKDAVMRSMYDQPDFVEGIIRR